jgi:hypothetical protein
VEFVGILGKVLQYSLESLGHSSQLPEPHKPNWNVKDEVPSPLAATADHPASAPWYQLICAIDIGRDFNKVCDNIRDVAREPSADIDDFKIDVCVFAVSLRANMVETSCVAAISEQGGKETQRGNDERHCSPCFTRGGDFRFCIG